jgi:hypothetical protein
MTTAETTGLSFPRNSERIKMEFFVVAVAVLQFVILVWFIVTLNSINASVRNLVKKVGGVEVAVVDLCRRGVLELRELNGKKK